MKQEIEMKNPQKILPWIGAPFMAAWALEGMFLLVGFTPHLLFVNYLIEALLVLLFCLSYRNRYQCYKAEPHLNITKYFWIELGIHTMFIIAATLQSAFNVWIYIGDYGLIYRHEFFFISLAILVLHIIYMCVDYYVTEKAAIVKCCRKLRGN